MTALSSSTSATAREVLLLVGKAISCSHVELHHQAQLLPLPPPPLQRLPPPPLQRQQPPRLQQQQQPRQPPPRLHRPQLQLPRPRQLLQLHQGPLQPRDLILRQGPVRPRRLVRNGKHGSAPNQGGTRCPLARRSLVRRRPNALPRVRQRLRDKAIRLHHFPKSAV